MEADQLFLMKKLAAIFICIGFALSKLSAQEPLLRRKPIKFEPIISTEKSVRLNFQNTPIEEVLRLYEILTTRPVDYDNSVSGPITLIVGEPIEKERAIRLIKSVLMLHDLIVLHAEGEPRTRIWNPRKSPFKQSIPVYALVKDLPQGQQKIAVVVQLKHAKREQLDDLLRARLPSGVSLGLSFSDDMITVVGSPDSIREVLPMLETFDTPEMAAKDAPPAK